MIQLTDLVVNVCYEKTKNLLEVLTRDISSIAQQNIISMNEKINHCKKKVLKKSIYHRNDKNLIAMLNTLYNNCKIILEDKKDKAHLEYTDYINCEKSQLLYESFFLRLMRSIIQLVLPS